ncbi:MAG: hypothetical protein M3N22_08600 [Acidobacteriota bacterium]|nr:hypothetical protein [Acidobacteriota bacterium]
MWSRNTYENLKPLSTFTSDEKILTERLSPDHSNQKRKCSAMRLIKSQAANTAVAAPPLLAPDDYFALVFAENPVWCRKLQTAIVFPDFGSPGVLHIPESGFAVSTHAKLLSSNKSTSHRKNPQNVRLL